MLNDILLRVQCAYTPELLDVNFPFGIRVIPTLAVSVVTNKTLDVKTRDQDRGIRVRDRVQD